MTARNFREVHVSILLMAYGEEPAIHDAFLLLREDVELEEFVQAVGHEIEDGTCGGSMVHTRSPKKPKSTTPHTSSSKGTTRPPTREKEYAEALRRHIREVKA